MEMTQTAFVDLLAGRFDIQYKTQTPASIEFDLGPTRTHERRAIGFTSRQLVVCCGSRG